MAKNNLISRANAHLITQTKIKTQTKTHTQISIKSKPITTKTINDLKNDNHHIDNIDYNKDHPIKFRCIACKKKECTDHSINKYHQVHEIKQKTKEILEQFKTLNEIVLLAQTQSGKSDVIKRILELFENNEEYFQNILKIESIIIILYASGRYSV
ncbi:MAG: hypothetical protein P4L31_04780 [Candidatus Babeliales bacterium]|nr:hypothetical protein [Candidatus Babeliales bacterium]